MGKSTKVGAFWIPRKEGSKAKLTGEIELNGAKVKCSLFTNDDYQEGGKKPKYVLLAFEDPTMVEPRTSQPRGGAAGNTRRGGGRQNTTTAPKSSSAPSPAPKPTPDDEVI